MRLRQRESEPHRARPDAPRGRHRAPADRHRHRVTRPALARPGLDARSADMDLYTNSKLRIVNTARL